MGSVVPFRYAWFGAVAVVVLVLSACQALPISSSVDAADIPADSGPRGDAPTESAIISTQSVAPTLPAIPPTPASPAVELPPSRTPVPALERVIPPTPGPFATTPADTLPANVNDTTATLDQPAEVDIVATLDAGFSPRIVGTYPAPDRYLEAEVQAFDCADFGNGQNFAYEVLVMRDVITESEEVVASQLISCGGLGAAGLQGLYWSSDGRFFYFTDARDGVPDGCSHWDRPIVRHDLIKRINTPLGGGPLAPNASQLATWQGRALQVHNLSKDEPLLSIEAAVPDADISAIAWAPDSRNLAYLQPRGGCPLGVTSVVLVSLNTGQQRILLTDHAPGFAGISWVSPSTITLVDESGQSWALDAATGEISPP